jgi:cell division protein FtsW (lipid II flippase)
MTVSLNHWARRLPWSILILANLLLALGWVGIARCEELTGGGPYLRLQMVWSALALAAMLAATLPSYRLLCRFSYGVFALALALLVLVYLFPPVNGARRWIRLGPLGLQPSEFAKVAYVLALARYLMYRDNYRRLGGLWLPLALTFLPVGLILREPDLGTSLVFLPVLFVMLFAAGARRWHLGILVLAGVSCLPVVWAGMSLDQQSRVTALFEQSGPGEPITPQNYQLRQAKQVMALGGWWGSLVAGPAIEDSAAHRLPEARSDFIFCILAERLGLVGIALLFVLYGLLIWRGLAVAVATREPFGRLVAVGLTFLIAVQVLINTGMNVGLLPITGISLPLVSYGGSGLLSEGILLGLLLNIGLRPGFEVTSEPFRYVEQ